MKYDNHDCKSLDLGTSYSMSAFNCFRSGSLTASAIVLNPSFTRAGMDPGYPCVVRALGDSVGKFDG